MSITRRIFLRNSALAVVGTAAVPSFLTRAAFGAVESGMRTKRLVVIFQRGAADGLNIVVPHAEPQYYAMRPSINIPKKAVLDLEWLLRIASLDVGISAAVAAGTPRDRACRRIARHDALALRCAGLHGNRNSRREDHRRRMAQPLAACHAGGRRRLRHFVRSRLGPSVPRILSGSEPAVAMNNINDFSVGGKNPKGSPAASAFEAMYDHSSDSVLHGTGEETFDAVKMLKAADPGKYTPDPGANYPKGRFGDSLRQLAQLIKANLGVQVAFADIGGWDHHVNEGAAQGQLANVLTDFSQALAAFWIDLGDSEEDTVVVTMSEFGRTARENGNRGTDHGHANVMFVLGGPVKGGKVYGRWPGLDQSQLYEGRDLALTTDFRQVIGEAVARHMGNNNLATCVSRIRQSAREVPQSAGMKF